MQSDDGLSLSLRHRLQEAMAEFLAAAESGVPVDRTAFLSKYADVEGHLRTFLAAHDTEPKTQADLLSPTIVTATGTTDHKADVTIDSSPSAKQSALWTAQPIAGAQRFGNYELLEEIARGGMGVVWKARHVKLNRVVALKMILSGQLAGPDDVQRFYAEAEAAAQLDHPGIVPIYEIGEEGGQHFFSMAFVAGESLAKRLAAGPLEPREAAELTCQVTEAIAYAHAHGVVHRDLKPANVLLEESGHPRVTDFGLAKRTEGNSQLTGTGQVLGTPSYMPPEQAAGKIEEIGPLSDVYSLGALLYALLTGRPPFQSASVMETLRQVLEQDPVPPRQLNVGVPIDLETICLKCLEKSAPKRYASAQDLVEDLRRYLRHEPIQARPVSRLERGYRWCKRKPALALSMLLGLLVAIGAVVLPVVFAVYKTHAAQKLAEEQTKTLAALDKAQIAERAALRQAAESMLDRATQLCEQAEVSRGLLTLTRGLELAEKADAADLAETFRWNLGAWGHEVHALQWTISLPGVVGGLSFHPSGEWLAAACWDKRLRLLSTRDGQLIRPAIELDAALHEAIISADGRALVASNDRGAHVFDIPADVAGVGLQKRLTITTGAAAGHAAFHPGGKLIATGGSQQLAQVWDVETGKAIGPPLSHTHQVYGIAFTADGKRLLTTGERGARLNVWSVPEGKLLNQFSLPQFTNHLSVSPSDKVVVAFAALTMAQQYDIATGQPFGPQLPHSNDVVSTAYSADGKWLLTGSGDRTARLWDAGTGKSVGSALPHRSFVKQVTFHPRERLVLTGANDGTISCWKMSSGLLARKLPIPGWGQGTTFSADGRELYVGSGHEVLHRWNAQTGERLGEVREPQRKPGHTAGGFSDLAVSRDGKTLYAPLHSSGNVAYLDTSTWKATRITISHGDEVQRLVCSPDGRFFVTSGNNWHGTAVGKAARLWDAATGKPYGELLQHAGPVLGLAVSPDSQKVLTGSHDGTVRVWDAATGKPLTPPIKQAHEVWAVDFSPDGKLAVTAGADRAARLWDLESWTLVGSPMAMQGTIYFVRFAAAGRLLVTAGEDSTVRLWSVATCKPVGPILRHDARLGALCVSPKGDLLATSSMDDSAKIWHIPAAVATSVDQTRNWVRAITGMDLEDDGNLQVLTADAWQRSLTAEPELAARLLVPSLFEELLLRENVESRLRSDRNMTEPVRQAALKLAATHPLNTAAIERKCWELVRHGGSTDPERYRRATQLADLLVREGAREPRTVAAIGAAQFRAGKYAESLATLERSRQLAAAGSKPPPTASLAFTLMARHKLGQGERVQSGLRQLRRQVADASPQQPELRALLRDVEWELTTDAYQWSPLKITSASSLSGATLVAQSDGSMLASGDNPGTDTFELECVTDLPRVAAVRLDVLRDDRLPSGGPGRAHNGNLVLTGFEMLMVAPGKPAVPVRFERAAADYWQDGFDPASLLDRQAGQGWAIGELDAPPEAWVRDHSVILSLSEPLSLSGGASLKIRLPQQSPFREHNLGRFRLSVSALRLSETSAAAPATNALAGTKAGQAWENSDLPMKFCWCPPGKFTMGSPAGEAGRLSDEGPVDVTISRGFWLGKFEVTQGQWKAVMGSRPWAADAGVKEGDAYPASYIDWSSAASFCSELTLQERMAGRLATGWEYRLPSEAQWEYACRAGGTTRFSFGDDLAKLGNHGWFADNAKATGHTCASEVGGKAPNAWGFYDMHGNVWEWTRDWLGPALPGGADPETMKTSEARVVRGGSWAYTQELCRAAYRGRYPPSIRINDTGFRVALVQPR